MTNDYTAHEIHRLDQAYPDAVNTLDDLTGDPRQKARLAEVGPEVFAAELTRDLANSAANPMSLAAWAAVATVRLMVAGQSWEDDTDKAWAKVDQLTAEREHMELNPTGTAHWLTHRVNELTAELAKVQEQLTAANRRADGLQAELDSAQRGLTEYANELARNERQAGYTLDDRDRAEQMADDLAEAIAKLTGVEIGEHSSMNNPWENALHAATERAEAVSA